MVLLKNLMILAKNNLALINTYLLGSLIISLTISIAISELIVFIICALFLFFVITKKKYYYFNNNFFKLFIILYFFLLVNLAFSKNFLITAGTTIPYIRYGILVLAIIFTIKNNENFFKILSIFLLTIVIFLLVDGYVQFFFGKNIFGYSTNSSRLSSIFGSKWVLGSFLFKLFPFLIILILASAKKNYFLLLGILFACYLLIFFSGERTAFYQINLYLILILPFFNLKKIFNIKTIIVFFTILFIIFLSQIKQRVFLLNDKISYIDKLSVFYKDNYKDFHVTSFKIFYDNKIIGSGVKTFRELCKEQKYSYGTRPCSTHPHNFYIQILSETGVLGFLIISIFFLSLLYKYSFTVYINFYKKNYQINYSKIILLSYLIVYLWPVFPSGNFFNNFLSIIFYIIIGIYTNYNKHFKIK